MKFKDVVKNSEKLLGRFITIVFKGVMQNCTKRVSQKVWINQCDYQTAEQETAQDTENAHYVHVQVEQDNCQNNDCQENAPFYQIETSKNLDLKKMCFSLENDLLLEWGLHSGAEDMSEGNQDNTIAQNLYEGEPVSKDLRMSFFVDENTLRHLSMFDEYTIIVNNEDEDVLVGTDQNGAPVLDNSHSIHKKLSILNEKKYLHFVSDLMKQLDNAEKELPSPEESKGYRKAINPAVVTNAEPLINNIQLPSSSPLSIPPRSSSRTLFIPVAPPRKQSRTESTERIQEEEILNLNTSHGSKTPSLSSPNSSPLSTLSKTPIEEDVENYSDLPRGSDISTFDLTYMKVDELKHEMEGLRRNLNKGLEGIEEVKNALESFKH